MFEGKVALITGGTKGIGRAAAHAFARERAKVAIVGLDASAGSSVEQEIRTAGGAAIYIRADVSQASGCEQMVMETVSAFGGLDLAFNCAGVLHQATAIECDEEAWDHVNGVNYKGVWLSMKYEIPAMLERGGGAIVNAASGSGVRGRRNRVSYVASKHGVIGLTKSAALDFAERNIRVNTLVPGPTWTPMMEKRDEASKNAIIAGIPMKRLGRPEEQAEAVIWLCSDRASFVTGASLAVDGGHQI